MSLIPLKVLLIEDSLGDQVLVQKGLAADSLVTFEVTIAQRLADGLNALARQHFDAVLLDLGLPDSQGLDTFQRLHTLYPELPVIVLSGLDDEEIAVQAMQNGAQDYLVKSVANRVALGRSVRYAAERQQVQLKLRESEEKFRSVVECSPDIILTVDHQMRIQFLNRTPTGLPVERVVGTSALAYVPSEYHSTVENTIRQVFETGQPASYEIQARGPDDRLAWYSTRLALLQRETQEPQVLLITQDITERKQAEEALRQSEERFAKAFQASPLSICITRPTDGLIIDVNPAFLSMFGYQREEVIGSTTLGLNLWDSLEERDRLLKLWGEQGRISQVETTFRRKSGRRGDMLMSAEWIDLADGRYLLSLMQDITERKCAEIALRESEERFQLFMNNSPTTASIKDEQGRYVYVNQTYEHRFGIQLADWRGKTAFDVWPPEVAGPIWQNDLATLAQGHRMEFIQKIPNPDSSQSTWWTFKFPIEDASGQRYVGGVALDITEREEIEAALYLTRFSIEHAADAVYWLDEAAQVVEVNETACQALGYSRDELLQLSFYDIAPGLSREAWQEDWQRLKQLRSRTSEWSHRTKEGRLIPVEMVANYIEFRGRSLNCAFVRDLSERKRAEETQAKLETQLHQAQKMESIGRLSGGVAHDFNNLLVVINGYSELLLGRYLDLSSPLRKYVEEINRAGERAAGLTQQLLAFSRKQVLQPKVVNLNQTVTQTEKMLRRLIGEDIDFITRLEPDLREVKADPGQIEQVMMNLVVNARDAMPTGGRLTIETANVSLDDHFDQTHPETLNGPGVRLTVADTGNGMDQETQVHIFEPFFTTKEQGKGTGLGLATVYGIIKQSGGEITVDSQPGQGAAFSLYLPAFNTDSTGSDEPLPEPVVQPGRETILLVEDEQTVRDFVRVALRGYGYTLLEVDHGYQALAIAQQQQEPIDLLLTDVVMPDINGRELAERIKGLHPHIKVLFMSGYTDDEVIQRGIQMAEVDFMAKPFSPVTLAAKVRELLDK